MAHKHYIVGPIPSLLHTQTHTHRHIHTQDYCKLIPALWRTVWRFLKKHRRKPPYDPAILVMIMCCAKSLHSVRLCVTLKTVAHQAPLFMGFSRQGYWSVLPFPPPGNLSDPGIEPMSLNLLHW